MSTGRKTTVGVFFGGRSVEHDVSIVTAQQIMQAFDSERYTVIPVYITRDGKWFTGEALRSLQNFKEGRVTELDGVQPVLLSPDTRHHGLIVKPLAGRFSKSEVIRLDVAFPAIHGSHGEDGTLQGLFELADIPYVGFATMGSAVTNDKVITRQVLRQSGIPVIDGLHFSRADWLEDPDGIVQRVETQLGYPVFVKPVTLGSSIGVSRADDPEFLRAALDIAANFDRRILVEKAITDGVEINCSVIGYGRDMQASVLEQPVSWDEFLSYEDKYLRGDEGMKSADRLIPAPLSPELTERIQQMSIDAFRAVDGRGIARIDYLVRPDADEVYLNEINTMPGSLAFYLWQETDIPPAQLVDRLVTMARDAYADKRRSIYDYETNLVSVAAGRGIKQMKGAKRGAAVDSEARPAESVEQDSI